MTNGWLLIELLEWGFSEPGDGQGRRGAARLLLEHPRWGPRRCSLPLGTVMNPQNAVPVPSEELRAQRAGRDVPLAPALVPRARMGDRAVPDPPGRREPNPEAAPGCSAAPSPSPHSDCPGHLSLNPARLEQREKGERSPHIGTGCAPSLKTEPIKSLLIPSDVYSEIILPA